MLRYFSLVFLFLLLLLPSCGLRNDAAEQPAVTPTGTTPAPAGTPDPDPTPDTAAQPLPTPRTFTLTVWTTADISPRSEIPGGDVLTKQLAAFDASHPDVELNVEIKTVTDQGGSLNYLRTGRDVAPDILPDLLLLPSDQLPGAAAAGLIYPLDSLIQQEMIDDLFPAANALGRVDGTLYGYPYVLSDLQHVVYDTNVITGTLPSSWTSLRDSGHSFVFPADGPKGAELGLQFYLAAGGRLTNDANHPELDVNALTAALENISQARVQGIIVSQSSNVISSEGAWQVFQSGGAEIAPITGAQFLNKRAAGFNSGFGPLPGPEGALVPQLKGSLWAITTADPLQQSLAGELLTWLSSPANLGEWSAESMMLPARRSAFEQWPGDPYIEFLQGELARGQPFPRTASGTIMAALGRAVSDVVSLAKTAPAAATEAAAAINP